MMDGAEDMVKNNGSVDVIRTLPVEQCAEKEKDLLFGCFRFPSPHGTMHGAV